MQTMVTNLDPGEIATAVGLTIPAFFSDAFDQLLQGEGGYLATGQPTGAIAQIGQAVGRSACRRYGAGLSGLSGAQSARYERACRPYLNTLQPTDGLGLAEPFEGGQCDAVYSVSGTYVSNQDDLGGCGETRSWSIGAINGPIQGVTKDPGIQQGWKLAGSRQPQNIVDSATGQQLLDISECGPSVGNGTRRASKPAIVSVSRLDGFPDNCGNPPPETVEPPAIPDPIGQPFRFSPVPGVDVQVEVGINPDGSITFDVGTGDVTVNPFQDEGNGGGGTPGDETDPGSPGSPSDTGAGGADSGEAGPGEELVGLLIQVLGTPENPNTFDNNAATVYRGIGYVRMGYPGRLGLDISGGTVLSPQFFHAPQRGLTSWAVNANLGFNIRTTPYYRSIE